MSFTDTATERWFLLAWGLLSLWLIACAWLVQGEYGDGYQTIVNARYLFGDSANYYVQRGPLAAIALWPVEFAVSVLAIDPLDVRPHHVLSAVLHSGYLLGCWLLLRRAPGTAAARLVAFAAAVLSVLFYAYAPYLSHDLLPGLMFLLQVFLCHRWLEAPTARTAIALTLLGAAVVLIKQTYALVWAALFAYAILAMLLKWDGSRVTPRKFFGLVLLAGASAVLSWLGYGLFIAGELPDVALLARPLHLVTAVSNQYGEELSGLFATDLYLRNLPNYGLAAVLLVGPGLFIALRGDDARQRQIAVCWLFAAIVVVLIDFREARYLAFLAPLTAMLVVPAVQAVLSRRRAAIALVLLVLVDQARGLDVAAGQVASAARSDVLRFVNAPRGDGRIVSSPRLSVVYDAASPLPRDRYHGIYHLTPDLLRGLYEGRRQVVTLDDPRDLGLAGLQPGDRVYYANKTMVRRPPWPEGNLPNGIADYLLVAGDVVSVDLERRGEHFQVTGGDGSYVMLVPAAARGQRMPVITAGTLTEADVAGLYGDVAGRERLTVTGMVVRALCQAAACRYR